MSARSLLKSMLVRSRLADAWIVATRSRMRILMYHGISPHCTPPDVFEEQLRYLSSRFDCLWVSEIPETLAKRDKPKRPPLVLTFDDGLRNNVTYAAPLLQRYGIKATFYIVSDLLDGNSMLWNHEMLCRMLLTESAHLPDEVPPLGQSRAQRFRNARRFIEDVKAWDNSRRLTLMDQLREMQARPEFEPWMLEKYLIMSRQELRSLPEVIEIGSHTCTHPILPTLDTRDAEHEIHQSGVVLESIIKRPVESFCYPSGRASERDERLAARYYPLSVSVEEGLVSPEDNRNRLRRIPAAHSMTDFVIRLIRPASGAATPSPIPAFGRP